jgi:hypothetical protein
VRRCEGRRGGYVIEQWQLDGQHLETPEKIDRGQLIIHDQRQFYAAFAFIQLDFATSRSFSSSSSTYHTSPADEIQKTAPGIPYNSNVSRYQAI